MSKQNSFSGGSSVPVLEKTLHVDTVKLVGEGGGAKQQTMEVIWGASTKNNGSIHSAHANPG